MKKRILAILLAVICLSCLLIFASCGGGNDDNGDDNNKDACADGHELGEWTTVTVESCTEAGLEKRVCANCDYEEERELPAGHNWREWETVTEATCDVDGEKKRECRECNETETETITAPGHEKVITTEAKEPTFDAPGTTEGAKCKNCDYIFSVATEIPKIGNIAKPDLVTLTQGQTWHSFENVMYYLFDGKADTAPHSPKGTPYALTFDLGPEAYVYEITVVCNGMGTVYNPWGSSELTEAKHGVKTVAITCYKDGEVVGVQRFEELDVDKVTEVTLEEVNSEVDTIEIYVETAGNNSNGDSYLWEINVVGTRQPTTCEVNGHTYEGENEGWIDVDFVDCGTEFTQERVCTVCEKKETRVAEAKGHTWTDWGYDIVGDIFYKEATCEEAGYEGRMCTVCMIEEYKDIEKLDHDWGDWDVVGNCADGATRTRICDVCEIVETETTAPGEHANVVYEGAVAPTKEQDGSTGVKKCLACGTTLAGNKILRFENVAALGTITSNASHWQVVGNDSWAPNTLLYLTDGKHNTGSPSCAQTAGSQWILLTFADAIELNDIVIVVNGSGNIGALGDKEQTNFEVDVTVAFYDENDELIFQETKNTKDVTAISFNNETGSTVKEIKVSYSTSYSAATLYIWEIETYVINELSACDANGHDWSEWDTQEPVCSQTGLTDGYRSRRCDACGELQEEVLVASHSFGDWNMTGINCSIGGTKTRVCEDCGKTESETVPAGDHLNIVLQDAILPTLEADGYTGNYVCTACGETTEVGQTIPKIVNEAENATVGTTGGWAIDGSTGSKDTRPHLNDGNMNTGMTTYTAQGNTTHSLTWDSAVTVDTIKVYFNGDGTDKTVGEFSDNLANTNANTTITVNVYGADGTTVVKTVVIQTKDLTEYTVSLDAKTQISKIELVCYVGWNAEKVVNIWECQAYVNYVAQ